MPPEKVQFYQFTQELALTTFLPLLYPHLPLSNPTYNRLQAPHNHPSRHCLFAATFPPNSRSSSSISSSSSSITPPPIPEPYTILFSDRSRPTESQIWIFNSLISIPGPLSPAQQAALQAHALAAILFLQGTTIPDAPGHPFHPVLRFACVHDKLAAALFAISHHPRDAVTRSTRWNLWLTSTANWNAASVIRGGMRALPEGYTIGRVPSEQLDAVISTSSIPRQPSTQALLPSVGVLNESGLLVAWGYIGIDGSFATLFVQPEYRGKGLSKIVAVELLRASQAGEFADMGFDGKSGWVHSDVYEGNEGSEAVMRSIGGRIEAQSFYIWIDSEKFRG